MSYESKHIDGDVSVGRNTAIGGDATVQGKTHLKGNVMVDGWLEAKNIKGVSKGLFTTIEKLKAAYPLPHDGWWALVGVSLPAPIYVGDGGEWVPTGQSGGNPTIDSGQYNEAVEKLQEDITKLQDDITDIEARNKAQLILDKIKEIAPDMPAIITGDFNCTPGEEPLQTLEKGGMENAAKTAAVTYGPSWSFHDFGRLPVEERVLLDYVFVTKGAKIDRYRVIQDKPENSYLSDHCPILVELTVQ